MDWGTTGIIFGIITTLSNVVALALIKFNDLKHLGISFDQVKVVIEKHGDKVDILSERLSRMEGICSVTCGKGIKTKKK